MIRLSSAEVICRLREEMFFLISVSRVGEKMLNIFRDLFEKEVGKNSGLFGGELDVDGNSSAGRVVVVNGKGDGFLIRTLHDSDLDVFRNSA